MLVLVVMVVVSSSSSSIQLNSKLSYRTARHGTIEHKELAIIQPTIAYKI